MNNYQSQNQQQGIEPMIPVGSPMGTPFFDQRNLQGYSNDPYPTMSNQRLSVNCPANPGYVTKDQVDARVAELLVETYSVMAATNNFVKRQTDNAKSEIALLKEQTKLEIALMEKSLKALQLDKTLAEDESLSQIDINKGRFTVIGKRGQTITLCDSPYVCLYIFSFFVFLIKMYAGDTMVLNRQEGYLWQKIRIEKHFSTI